MRNNSDKPKNSSSNRSSRFSRRGSGRRFNPPVVQEDAGKWIWIDDSGESRNAYIYVRKLFELKAQPTSATIKAASDTRYKLYVNGDYIGKGPVRSRVGYTYYDTYDITEHLSKGKNVIAFLAHHIGAPTNFAPVKLPGLVCKADITVDEENITIVTDETWKVHKAEEWTDQGARISEALGYQEVYDSSLRMDEWNEIKFKEKGWQDAVVVGSISEEPWGQLVERQIPQLSEEKVYPQQIVGLYNSPERSIQTPPSYTAELIAASELSELKSGSIKSPEAVLSEKGAATIGTPRSDAGVVMILDFGREVFGNVELGASGSGVGIIDIAYSEILEDGRVKPDRAGMKYTDRITLKKGKLEWQGFEPRAFRYMQIEFRRCSRSVMLDYVRVNETVYPVQQFGDFDCSDPIINEIWRIGVQTAKLCMEDTFIDSPWRERAQWWGDARVLSRVAFYAFDDVAMLTQGLRQFAAQQDDEGWILGMYPGGSDAQVPDYSLFWVFSLLDYYAFADDAGLLRDLYRPMRGLLAWFGKYIDSDGLLAEVPGWMFIDWAEIDKRGQVTAINCLYYQALRVASAIASITGKDEDAVEYAEAASKLRLAINKLLFAPRRGLYADSRVEGVLGEAFSRQTNILAALFDVPDHYRKSSLVRALIGPSLPELNTPYFASMLVETLCASERHVDAMHTIRKKWGAMVKAGASTFGEFFDGEGSRCHGWSVGPVRDLIAEFVGIKPVIGSHRFTIAPRIGDLKWARGTVNTKDGPLAVDWKILRGVMTIAIEVPQGVKVDVMPPCPENYRITVNSKPHLARFITLSGGSHTIKISMGRPSRQAPPDKSLEPKPIPHVELLAEAPSRGRRRLSTTDRRRTKTTRSTEPVVETEVDAVEIVEQVIEVAAEAATEVTEGKTRKRRTRRGRDKTAEIQEAAPVEQVETAIVAEPGEPQQHGEEHRSKRRRSRRGGRGRSRGEGHSEPQSAEAATDVIEHAVVAEPEKTETVVNEEPAVTPSKSRRRRSRRGGRGRSGAAVEQAPSEVVEAVEVVEDVAVVEPSPETAGSGEQEALRPPRRRSRRWGRGRPGRHAEAVANPEPTMNEPEPAPEPVIEQPTERPAKPARRRNDRTRKPEPSAPAAVELPSQPVVEVPVQEPEQKPARRSTRRRTPKAAEQPVVEAAVAPVEPVPEPVSEAPKRRRTYARKPKPKPETNQE